MTEGDLNSSLSCFLSSFAACLPCVGNERVSFQSDDSRPCGSFDHGTSAAVDLHTSDVVHKKFVCSHVGPISSRCQLMSLRVAVVSAHTQGGMSRPAAG